MTRLSFIECANCKAVVQRTGPVQKFCVDCSSARDRERKNKWAKANPPPAQRSAEYGRRTKESSKQAGAKISQREAETIVWCASEGPDLLWLARTSVPFSWRGSKNAVWSTNSRGHIYARREAKDIRRSITDAVARAVDGQRIANNKLWIDLLIQKTNHKGDAVNFVDLVCDGIKDAIDLDDRWYSIRRLDWQIVKVDPRIFIGIGQESDEDMNACSTCGRIQPLSAYGTRRDTKLGVARICNQCRSEGRALRRKAAVADVTWREALGDDEASSR